MLSCWSGAAEAAVESDVESVEGFLPSLGPAGPAFACGVERHDGEVDALERGLLVGEVTAGSDGLADAGVDRLDRVRGAHDASDLAVEAEERDELGPGVLPQPHDCRVLVAPRFGELEESFLGLGEGRGLVHGLQGPGDGVPVLPGGVLEAVAHQVHDAGLHDRLPPHRVHRLGQPLEAVAHHHQDVVDAAVLELGEDLQPVLGAFPAVSCPQAEDVPVALRRDGKGDVDGSVGDLAVSDLDVDRVDEHHRVDRAVSSDRCELIVSPIVS